MNDELHTILLQIVSQGDKSKVEMVLITFGNFLCDEHKPYNSAPYELLNGKHGFFETMLSLYLPD